MQPVCRLSLSEDPLPALSRSGRFSPRLHKFPENFLPKHDITTEQLAALSAEEIDKRLALLKDACASDDDLKAKKALRKAVPTFKTPEEVNRTAFEKNEKENEEKQKKGLKVALF